MGWTFSDTTAIGESPNFDPTDSSVWWLVHKLHLTSVPTSAKIRQIRVRSTLIEWEFHQIWREVSRRWVSACSMCPLSIPTHSRFIHHICRQNVGALYPFLHVLEPIDVPARHERRLSYALSSEYFNPIVAVCMSFSQCLPHHPAQALLQGFCCDVCPTFCRLWQHLSFCLEGVARRRSQRRWSAQAVAGRLRL